MMCCYAKKTITDLRCESSDNNYLSSCEDLLKILALRVFIWILGTLALLGNIGVIFYWNRLANIDPGDRGKKSRVQSFLLTNLAVSDLQMGIYLIIIAFQDSMWQDEYFKHDYEWRISMGCQISGALSMVSSEASVLILTTITADRFNSIVFHFRARPFNMKSARIVCAGIWILSLLMSLAPFTFHILYGNDWDIFFYGRSSVCLPLQLSTARPTGWEYAVFVYIAFNGCAFLFILLAYIAIFFKVKTSSKQVRSNMKNDSSLALRVVLIIVTDFCCWIPVVIIGCLSLAGQFRDSSGQAYAWIAVFVLPINSSINPLLYTFSNPQFRRLFNLRKLFDKCTGRTNGKLNIITVMQTYSCHTFCALRYNKMHAKLHMPAKLNCILILRPTRNTFYHTCKYACNAAEVIFLGIRFTFPPRQSVQAPSSKTQVFSTINLCCVFRTKQQGKFARIQQNDNRNIRD